MTEQVFMGFSTRKHVWVAGPNTQCHLKCPISSISKHKITRGAAESINIHVGQNIGQKVSFYINILVDQSLGQKVSFYINILVGQNIHRSKNIIQQNSEINKF